MAKLLDSLITPMGIVQIMVEPVDLVVNQYEELRPDRFFSDHYLTNVPAIHLGLNQINGMSALSFKAGLSVGCFSYSTLASFLVGVT